MAVETMEMMNVVGPIEKINHIAKEIVMSGNVHMVNALNEINESNFTLCVMEENIDELVDICVIRPYREDTHYKEVKLKIENMMKYFHMDSVIKEEYLKGTYDFQEDIKKIEEIYPEIDAFYKEIEHFEEELKSLQDFNRHIRHIKDLEIDLDSLNHFHFFRYKIGILSKENRIKLKNNYENISAIVFHIGSNHVGEVYLVISPKELETETDRILRSLNFLELNMPKEFSGRPKEVVAKIEKRKEEIQDQLHRLHAQLEKLKEKYQTIVEQAYSRLRMEEEMMKVKNETACTNSFFYLSGWVPKREKEHIRNIFQKYGHEILIMFKETSEVYKYLIPPTKLKNNKLLRPFETLVKMYGVPSYDEMDPTLFLSITYMILFGAMFGDVGQGLVLFLMGIYFCRQEGKRLFGEILSRLGMSSTLFGFLYGSIFGFEHIIPALLIRPIENISHMLAGSVILGVVLLLISFGYGILNAIKQKNLKEGVFGRNGMAGLLFYLVLLALIVNGIIGKEVMPKSIGYTLLILLMAVIVIREPLTHLIQKKRPLYEESASSYYIESGFEIFETLMNMLSNTVSFIRVGAFALNHVGLFIAFHTMAEIVNSFAGSIVIFILGNVIVIGLEGLIVFIQGLRLEYYEMFSKYYHGEGIEFNPVRLEVKN